MVNNKKIKLNKTIEYDKLDELRDEYKKRYRSYNIFFIYKNLQK